MQTPQELTLTQYLARESGQQGLCLRCGNWCDGTNPGTARASCDACGKPTLHGVEQALLLGAVHIRW
jgi:hypothetical protein